MIYSVNKENSKSCGAYGQYFKHGKQTGLKVIDSAMSESFSSIPYRLFHKDLAVAFLESVYFNLIHGSESSSIIICRIYENSLERYFLGLKTPHFKGRQINIKKYFITSDNQITRKRTKKTLMGEIVKKYESKGIFNHDINDGNVLVDKNNVNLIDFSPELIQYFGSRKIFEKELNKTFRNFEKEYSHLFYKKINKKTFIKLILKIANIN